MSTNWSEQSTRLSHAAGSRLVIRSALNPLLWLCATFCPSCCVAAYLFRTDPFAFRYALVLSAAPVLTTCGIAVHFAVSKPERLQSASCQTRPQGWSPEAGRGTPTTATP